MRYGSSEKLEIVQLHNQSHLPVERTLTKLGIAMTTFYRCYGRHQTGGPPASEYSSKDVQKTHRSVIQVSDDRLSIGSQIYASEGFACAGRLDEEEI